MIHKKDCDVFFENPSGIARGELSCTCLPGEARKRIVLEEACNIAQKIAQTAQKFEKEWRDYLRKEYKDLEDSSPEIVICSAVRAKDGKIVRGHRHFDALRALQAIPGYEKERPGDKDQGFITSLNRYVSREEGYQIQVAAGIESHDKKNPYRGKRLYSEDLY